MLFGIIIQLKNSLCIENIPDCKNPIQESSNMKRKNTGSAEEECPSKRNIKSFISSISKVNPKLSDLKKTINYEFSSKNFFNFLDQNAFDEKDLIEKLIEEYSIEKNNQLIQRMLKYFENAPKMSVLKNEFLDVFESLSQKGNLHSDPSFDYSSVLREEYFNISRIFLESDSEIPDDQNTTLSEKIKKIIFSINKFPFYQNTKKLVSCGCILHPTILKLIDDSVIKLQYELSILFCMLKCSPNKKNSLYLRIFTFIVERKIFIKNCIDSMSNDQVPYQLLVEQKTIDGVIKQNTPRFESKSRPKRMSQIESEIFKRIDELGRNDHLEKLTFQIIIRLRILNNVFLNIRSIIYDKYERGHGFNFKKGNELPYYLLTTFLKFH